MSPIVLQQELANAKQKYVTFAAGLAVIWFWYLFVARHSIYLDILWASKLINSPDLQGSLKTCVVGIIDHEFQGWYIKAESRLA